jgi:hypothetical protein
MADTLSEGQLLDTVCLEELVMQPVHATAIFRYGSGLRGTAWRRKKLIEADAVTFPLLANIGRRRRHFRE